MDRFYILTRFNLRLWATDKKQKPTQTDEWLKTRFELFEKYCLPSVAAQRMKDFKWIVLFDENTPAEYTERFANYKKLCPQFRVVKVKSEYGYYFANIFQQIIEKDIERAKEKGQTTDNVITSYLDNDDALSDIYLEKISQIVPSVKQSSFISFCHGLQYHEKWQLMIQLKYSSNHFITLVEPYYCGKQLRTVFGYGSHTQLFNHRMPVLCIDDRHSLGWLEVVHEGNVFNDIISRRIPHLFTDEQLIKSSFHINIPMTSHPDKVFYGTFLWEVFKTNCVYYKQRIGDLLKKQYIR